MKALLSRASRAGPRRCGSPMLPDPQAGPGELLVRVRACAINFPDVLIIEDKYQLKPPRPFAPGGEVAGEVEAVGEGVEGWDVGDRLIAVPGFGGLVEKIVIPAKIAFRLPADAQLRGWRGAAADLRDLDPRAGRPRPAAGRARRCWCSARPAESASPRSSSARRWARGWSPRCRRRKKPQAARDAGADEAMVYPPGPFDRDGQKALAELFKGAVGPAGADVIFDPVGGDYAEPALRSIGWEGRYLVVGFPAGIPKLPLNLTLLKSCDVCGVFWGAFAMRDPKANAAHVEQLFRWWDEGKIAPRISATFPLERAGEAITAIAERRAIGKLVVTL